MDYIYENNKIKIFEFVLKINKLIYVKIDHMYPTKWIRFALASIGGGSRIYYLFLNDEPAGYCMVTRGKGFRHSFANKDDIVVGPIFISPQFRGKGRSILLINTLMNYYKDKYSYSHAYAYIHESNVASNKLFQHFGFRVISKCFISKFLRRVYISEKDNLAIQLYIYKNEI